MSHIISLSQTGK